MAILFLTQDKQKLTIRCSYEERNLAKKIGGQWNPSLKTWDFAIDLRLYDDICSAFGKDLVVEKDAHEAILSKKIETDTIRKFKEEAVLNEDINYNVLGLSFDGKNPLYTYQKHGVRCGSVAQGGFLIADEMGLGKGIVSNYYILTPYRKKMIKDLVVGDEVIGKNGLSTKVTGVFPQGIQDIYRITFNDGYFIDCDKSHLWEVSSTNNGNNTKSRRTQYEVLSVEQMIDKDLYLEKNGIGFNKNKKYKFRTYYKKDNGDSRWQIPMSEPIEFNNNDVLPIEPYLLGLCLGDGCIGKNHVSIEVSNDDFFEFFQDFIKLEDDSVFKERKSFKKTTRKCSFYFVKNELNKLNLANKRSWNKFIPDIYKYSSVQNRLKILQGLMDTDGYCMYSKNGKNFSGTEYCSVSERLADDVAEIVHSLGGIVRKRSKDTSYKDKNGDKIICKKAFRLNIKMSKQFNPFKLKRKRDNYLVPQKYSVARYIKNIEYIGKQETICIAVDAEDKLYVADHAIVTHNTIQGIGISLNKKMFYGARSCLIICPAAVKYVWLNEISKFTKEKAIVIDGKVEERYEKWFAPGYFFKITNYEILTRDLFYFEKMDKNGNITSKDNRIPNHEQLINNFFSTMMVDEAHYLSSHKAQRTIACKSMKVKTKIALTGTPIDGKLEGFHSIIEFIKPGLLPTKSKFLDRYAIFDHWGGIERYIRVNEFKEKISPYYIRRLKKDVLKDLPPIVYQNVYVEFSPKAMNEYKKIARGEHEITMLEEMIVTIIRCRQYCDMPDILGLKTESDKLNVLKEILEEIVKENGHKVIIFSQYREAINRLNAALKKDYELCLLKDFENKFQASEYFNNTESCKIILMTDEGNAGLNLPTASYVIHYDQNYSPAVMMQRSARAHRANTKHTVNVINLICKDTIEERVLEAINQKHEFSCNVLDEDLNEMSLGSTLNTRELFNLL